MMSAEGAAQKDSISSAGPSGLDGLPNQHPELTLGSTRCRRFAAQGRPTSESWINAWQTRLSSLYGYQDSLRAKQGGWQPQIGSRLLSF